MVAVAAHDSADDLVRTDTHAMRQATVVVWRRSLCVCVCVCVVCVCNVAVIFKYSNIFSVCVCVYVACTV